MPSAPFSTITRINSTIKDLLTNIFDLSPLEVDLLLFLIANNDKNLTLEELAKETNRDKSTAFRSLQKLVNLGICIKETSTMKGGGYYHKYSAIDVKSFKILTERKVKELQQSFDRLLKHFEHDLDQQVMSFYKKKQK
jgi:predicted transcriptional regulator